MSINKASNKFYYSETVCTCEWNSMMFDDHVIYMYLHIKRYFRCFFSRQMHYLLSMLHGLCSCCEVSSQVTLNYKYTLCTTFEGKRYFWFIVIFVLPYLKVTQNSIFFRFVKPTF